MINVCLAGTGGMLPIPGRWLTSFWVEHEGRAALVDCGEGTQIALAQHGCRLSSLEAIFITHTHADHISGLPGLLLSLGNCGKTEPLRIYGGIGIADTVKKLCCICPFLPFGIEVAELPADQPSELLWNGMTVRTLPLRHSVECLGYSFTLYRKPVFAPEKAKSLGVDVKLWSRLHSGESVESGGRLITPEMVTAGERAPIKLTYITDTSYFVELTEFARDSDLLVCEGMYGDDEYTEKMTEKGHMVFSQSAAIAADSGSRRLWLTHYSPALKEPQQYERQVRSIFPETVISADGERIVLK